MRVSLLCRDRGLREWASKNLRRLGVDLCACASPRELVPLAKRSDILIVMTDTIESSEILRALESIDGLSAAPALLLLGSTDIAWHATGERTVIRGRLTFLEWPLPDPDRELPFTD